MHFHRTASILALLAVTTFGLAQAPPAGRQQRSGYGGADQGTVGTTDDAGHSTDKFARHGSARQNSHVHSRGRTGSAQNGTPSTNNGALNNTSKTTQTYNPHPPRN